MVSALLSDGIRQAERKTWGRGWRQRRSPLGLLIKPHCISALEYVLLVAVFGNSFPSSESVLFNFSFLKFFFAFFSLYVICQNIEISTSEKKRKNATELEVQPPTHLGHTVNIAKMKQRWSD